MNYSSIYQDNTNVLIQTHVKSCKNLLITIRDIRGSNTVLKI